MSVLNCNSGPQGTRGRPRCLHGARASPCTAEDLTVSVLAVFVLTVVGRSIAVVAAAIAAVGIGGAGIVTDASHMEKENVTGARTKLK